MGCPIGSDGFPRSPVGVTVGHYNEGPPMGDRRAFATKRYSALI
jgi:hypothetical protein